VGADDTLSTLWNATNTTPLADTAYEYQTTIRAYDSLGSTHDVTLYFDKADTPSSYEFIVTCNPAEDYRTGVVQGTSTWAGLLARGLINFDSSGSMTGNAIEMWNVDPADGSSSTATGDNLVLGSTTDMSNGYFTFSPAFLSGGSPQTIELNLGTRYDGTNWINSSLASTQYASGSTTTFQSANGYGAGDLEGVNVDVDGVITGSYSNGQLIPLYRVGLAKFQNTQGLFKEGGNLYSETRQSGSAITNKPGTNGLGSIAPNALEQSNVDIANELVKMITTQRGFQANSKIITVTDQMLAELINIKR